MFLAWKRVSCILRYLGRGTGAPPLFLLLSLKGWQPPFCLSVYPRAHDILFYSRRRRSRTDPRTPFILHFWSRRIEKKWQLLSLTATLCVCLDQMGGGQCKGIKGNGAMGVGMKQSNLAFTSLQEMHVNTGRISRNCFWGGRFSIRVSSHAHLILYEMFLRSRKLIIFNKKRKWELSSKVQNLVWLIFFFY